MLLNSNPRSYAIAGIVLLLTLWLVFERGDPNAVVRTLAEEINIDSQDPTATPAISPTHMPPCNLAWEIVPSANVANYENVFKGISSVSTDDIWAVGNYRLPDQSLQILSEHWDGVAWSVVTNPNPTTYDFLNDVDAISANDVWAVGATGGQGQNQPVVQHWDGVQWSTIPSPNPGRGYLARVEAIAPDDVWAVGYSLMVNTLRTVIMHWDGNQWSIIPAPSPGASSKLNDIEAISANDIWAVGGYAPGDLGLTLALHWNGMEWEQIPSPNANVGSSQLKAISALSSNDIWAIGDSSLGTLTMHWDGVEWRVVPSPNMGTERNLLYDIVALTHNDVWAVGHYDDVGRARTLTLHWDGNQWSIVPSPSPVSGYNLLFGVGADQPGNVWAVGSYSPPTSGGRTLVLRYPPCPTSTPTSTPSPSPPPTSTPTPTPPCNQTWEIVPSPNIGNYGNHLTSLSVISDTDIWAAGYYVVNAANLYHTLTLHWDGVQWTAIPSPIVGTGNNYLEAVEAISTDDVWAVGQYAVGNNAQPMTMHWDGIQWNVVSNPGPSNTILYGVSGTGRCAENGG